MKYLLAALPLLVVGIAHADSVEWKLDLSHSSVGFSVPHLVISSVDGRFKEASAKISLDDADPTKSQASVEINTASIDTGDQKRDDHLKGPDFFDVNKFPKIAFKSTKIVKAAGKAYKLTGDLTIRDITKSVTLDATLSPPVKTPWGNQARAAKLSGKIKRGDFGLKWNKALEAGGVVVGDDVTIDVKAEVTK
jgi:polyisoprenoid-binding protein YceI